MALGDVFSGLGAGIGGLLGATGGGSKPAGTTTTTQGIPDWLMPYVTGNLSGAQTTRDQFTGQNNGLMNLAVPGYAATLRGDYLNPDTNPYLASTFGHAADLTNARINSTFEGANRYGSGQQAGAIGTADSMLASNIFGGNYQAERARQNAAIGGVPQFNQGASSAAFSPYSQFNNLIPGLQTQTSPYFTNPMGSALSGALAGGILGGAGGLPSMGDIGSFLGLGGGGGIGAGAGAGGSSFVDTLLSLGGDSIPFFL